MPTNLYNSKEHYSASGRSSSDRTSPCQHEQPKRKQTDGIDLLLTGLLLLIEVIEMRKKGKPDV